MSPLKSSSSKICIPYLLDNDVTCTTDNPQTFALYHSTGTGSDQAFIALDRDTENASIVTE